MFASRSVPGDPAHVRRRRQDPDRSTDRLGKHRPAAEEVGGMLYPKMEPLVLTHSQMCSSLPELEFILFLFAKTIFVVNNQFGRVWPIHFGNEVQTNCRALFALQQKKTYRASKTHAEYLGKSPQTACSPLREGVYPSKNTGLGIKKRVDSRHMSSPAFSGVHLASGDTPWPHSSSPSAPLKVYS